LSLANVNISVHISAYKFKKKIPDALTRSLDCYHIIIIYF
jgi:hypothetical protein